MTKGQLQEDLPKEAVAENNGEGASLPLRRSGRARRGLSHFSPETDAEKGKSGTASGAGEPRRKKRKAAEETFELPENLLEASLGPWKPDEQAEWASWIEVESDPAFFTAILGLIGVKGAKIEEVLSVDEDSLASLPHPVYGLVFLYEYVAEESVEETEDSRDVWFANQTTQNACATIALLNILMNAEGVGLDQRLRKFKQDSKDLSPPLRGNMISNSDWIRVAHNSFARRLDLLNAALALQNEVDKRERAKAAANKPKRKKPKVDKAKNKSDETTAYHFIAYVPVGQRVWQLDGLTTSPVCIGEYQKDQHWTSVMQPVLQERMMRYETERLSFSLLALCGDGLSHIREKLAVNIRSLSDLNSKYKTNPSWNPSPDADIIHNPSDERLSTYQLEDTDILTTSQPDAQPSETETTGSPKKDMTVEEATKLWTDLCEEQKRLRSEYESELRMGGQHPDATLGRTKDYTAAIHEWVKKLADHGVLRRLAEEVS